MKYIYQKLSTDFFDIKKIAVYIKKSKLIIWNLKKLDPYLGSKFQTKQTMCTSYFSRIALVNC